MEISRQQALECFRSDDLIGIGMEANAVRRRLHPEGVVGYAVNCAIGLRGDVSGEEICAEIREAVDRGSRSVRLRGSIEIETALRSVRRSFPELWIEGPSATQILSLAKDGGLAVRDTISRLVDAGMSSLGFDDTQPQCRLEEWIAVHRAAHGLGVRTAATMYFGMGETPDQRIDFLQAVHQLQEETGGFTAFIPAPAKAANGRELDAVTAVEQMKTLAIARIFLDKIENIQWNAAAQSLKVLQTGLRFGANDTGSIAPNSDSPSEEDLRRVIREAGFQPVQRDASYSMMFLN
jgi:cyclic dehypoxanthinyl futalosine synthase